MLLAPGGELGKIQRAKSAGFKNSSHHSARASDLLCCKALLPQLPVEAHSGVGDIEDLGPV